MADDKIPVSVPGLGTIYLDAESLAIVGGVTGYRERMQIAGATLAEIARVRNSEPISTDHGLIVRSLPAGIQQVNVVAKPVSSTTTSPTRITVNTTASQIFAANAIRKRFLVANVGTTTIKFALGSVDPTQTAYHLALPPGAATDDAKGGIYIDEMWTGRLAAISEVDGGVVLTEELT